MGLQSVWKSYKVLIVMGAGLGVVHWGWYNMQYNSIFHPEGEGRLPPVFRYLLSKETDTKDK
ncbi:hypothetical protein GDO81_008628 [Engystomops pustulosus]|uniref:Uncharacterized protein n=1 Tax=Engystomops pustulosus TaxID=76066 RepID=A0AAV7CG08_ENGPU|nr:hypothetical protein GDO81_008628 [Engystomops pustulosus]